MDDLNALPQEIQALANRNILFQVQHNNLSDCLGAQYDVIAIIYDKTPYQKL